MGKQKQLKKIRRAAKVLPQIIAPKKVQEKVFGTELLEHGIKEVGGQKVEDHKQYIKNSKVNAPVDHYKEMKAMYNKGGKNAVGQYANAVVQFAKQKQDADTVQGTSTEA